MSCRSNDGIIYFYPSVMSEDQSRTEFHLVAYSPNLVHHECNSIDVMWYKVGVATKCVIKTYGEGIGNFSICCTGKANCTVTL